MGPSRENPGQAPDSVRTRVARPLGGGNYAMQGCDTPTERFAWRKTPTGLEGAGGRGSPEGLAAVPGGGDGGSEGAWPRQISHVISDGHFLRSPKNVAIPTR